MCPSAIVFSNLRLDKKAMENMREQDVALCIPLSTITSTYSLQRSKTLYWMNRLFRYAKSIRLNVSFATLARSSTHLCSCIQLVELAKLLDEDEKYIKYCISETNRSLVRVKT
jgi:RNase P/RNase MRP subunit p30